MTEYQYDKRGYLSSVTEPDGDSVSYAYVQNDPINFCDPGGMRQVKGIDASGTSGSIYSVKKSTTSGSSVYKTYGTLNAAVGQRQVPWGEQRKICFS